MNMLKNTVNASKSHLQRITEEKIARMDHEKELKRRSHEEKIEEMIKEFAAKGIEKKSDEVLTDIAAFNIAQGSLCDMSMLLIVRIYNQIKQVDEQQRKKILRKLNAFVG